MGVSGASVKFLHNIEIEATNTGCFLGPRDPFRQVLGHIQLQHPKRRVWEVPLVQSQFNPKWELMITISACIKFCVRGIHSRLS